MVSASATIEIARSPAHVRRVFLDFARFHEWCQGPVKAVQTLAPGGRTDAGDKVKVSFGGGISATAEISENSPTQFKWRTSLPGLLKAEHTFRFEDSKITPGWTTFINSETFTGFLSLLGGSHDGSSPGFEKFNQSLKQRAESIEES
ncbi:hypothetical protein F5B22DRAFT_615696 [Xylaria bambusicola]|uniref:uncharacterized protein n=1 Tax=Xylaria bambusicola TaxID=326684 RepID=UPI002007D6AC|nr:uncharacterized protein F5B22DRAFT_615696 [Xylaria bambusicola]KAI0509702.1 hypothetical protein F5B22DRAFT_615696 [Xylaria bambusicola]